MGNQLSDLNCCGNTRVKENNPELNIDTYNSPREQSNFVMPTRMEDIAEHEDKVYQKIYNPCLVSPLVSS